MLDMFETDQINKPPTAAGRAVVAAVAVVVVVVVGVYPKSPYSTVDNKRLRL
jgi:hypothetical protein